MSGAISLWSVQVPSVGPTVPWRAAAPSEEMAISLGRQFTHLLAGGVMVLVN